MKTLRVGVSRLREELSALLGTDVGEVAGPADRQQPADSAAPAEPVLVGTEAVLHRVRRASAVSFLDIDLHLLAPRLSATEDTLSLLVRAGRLVGPRGSGPTWARVQAQTRVPEHPVLVAATAGQSASVLEAEGDIRRASALPPFSALALVSGTLSPAYADSLGAAASADPRISVSPLGEARFLVQAPDHRVLCDLLGDTLRPAGRGLRVEVDPSAL
jgi:primosomal protein N' (replication factor Y)